jgi:hypothetical protein
MDKNPKKALVTGYWLLVTGYWLPVIGCKSCCQPAFIFVAGLTPLEKQNQFKNNEILYSCVRAR